MLIYAKLFFAKQRIVGNLHRMTTYLYEITLYLDVNYFLIIAMLFTHVEIDDFLLIWTFGGKDQKEPRQCITNPVLGGILLIIIIIFILNL